MESLMHLIDRLVILRLSLLLGYVITYSTPFSRLLSFFMQPAVFKGLIEPLFQVVKFIWQESLEPFIYIAHLVHSIFSLIYDLAAPVFIVVWELVKIALSLCKLFLYTPSMTLLKLLTLLFDGVMGFLSLAKESLSFLKTLATPFSSQRSRQTTMSFLQVCQQIGLSWSQSIHKKVI
jgi:hypothetical protein